MKKFKSFVKEEDLKDFEEDVLAGKKLTIKFPIPTKTSTEEKEKEGIKKDENI